MRAANQQRMGAGAKLSRGRSDSPVWNQVKRLKIAAKRLSSTAYFAETWLNATWYTAQRHPSMGDLNLGLQIPLRSIRIMIPGQVPTASHVSRRYAS
jgi:hypothetical protein